MIRDLIYKLWSHFPVGVLGVDPDDSLAEVVKVMRASSPGIVALGCYWEWGGVPSSSLVVTS